MNLPAKGEEKNTASSLPLVPFPLAPDSVIGQSVPFQSRPVIPTPSFPDESELLFECSKLND